MSQFPHSRYQIIQNYTRNHRGRWLRRADQCRQMRLDRLEECQRFLRRWLNTGSEPGHREVLNADSVAESQV